MNDFNKLETTLGIEFKDKDLLTKAFCHRSYINEHRSFKLGHNERLEFLGDAVLELIVTDYLFHNYPDKPEGELTSWRSSLVNSKMLGEVAGELHFNDFLLLSKGEQSENGKARNYILGDTFEAFLGSLFLDQGYESCDKFVKRYLIPRLDDIVKQGLHIDAKSRFQEAAQERMGATPTYEMIKEWGPDHDKHFLIGVLLGEEQVAEGEGTSKREAEEEAARVGLDKKGW